MSRTFVVIREHITDQEISPDYVPSMPCTYERWLFRNWSLECWHPQRIWRYFTHVHLACSPLVDDQLILVEFQRKFGSTGEFIRRFFPVLFQPVRQLFRADVTALSVVQPSEISTLSPSSNVSSACAPFTRLFEIASYLAAMEKEVIGKVTRCVFGKRDRRPDCLQ